MPSNESGSGATTSGGIRVQHYYPVGPAVHKKKVLVGVWILGWRRSNARTTTLNGAINDTAGTGGQ